MVLVGSVNKIASSVLFRSAMGTVIRAMQKMVPLY